MRLDVRMAQDGLAVSREKARAVIMAGEVLVNGKKAEKAGMEVPDAAVITVKANPIPYVSRGGLKLEKAMATYPICLNGSIAADIGASTGGFTDCMLQNGAKKVYAIDVGYGQLDWTLRNDSRVVVMERTNARNMEPDWFQEELDFASIDVSFISLRLMLPPLYRCLKNGGTVVALIKPQFEAGRSEVGKNGVVHKEETHISVCERILQFAQDTGYTVLGLTFSPITGPKGNIEFLAYLQKNENSHHMEEQGIDVKTIVLTAHREIDVHK
ncbi:MAG: TlyA family RNA methyltransferase [Eubacteriales bacterium]|nr:TlyA family RNA methyltransferase [Eubacteriales bacterium]